MTEKVFYQDSYRKTLSSEIVELTEDGAVLWGFGMYICVHLSISGENNIRSYNFFTQT